MREVLKSKKDTVIELVEAEKYKEALRIAKGFVIEFSKTQRKVLSIAYECMTGKEKFYVSLGWDCELVKRGAIELLKKYPNH